jgi:hypothetical protein
MKYGMVENLRLVIYEFGDVLHTDRHRKRPKQMLNRIFEQRNALLLVIHHQRSYGNYLTRLPRNPISLEM